jgi:hypothetical protein
VNKISLGSSSLFIKELPIQFLFKLLAKPLNRIEVGAVRREMIIFVALALPTFYSVKFYSVNNL